MKYLPQNTLAYFNSSPQTKIFDLSTLPTKVFSVATKKYRHNTSPVFPNNEALNFYALNHCASIVRKQFTPSEPLPVWAADIMQQYTEACADQGLRMLHYILCITVREMRHLESHGGPSEAFWAAVKATFTPRMLNFLKLVVSNGDEETAMGRYMNEPPDVNMGTYLRGLSYGFHKAEGWSTSVHTSFGGPKWGNVVDAVTSMIMGKISMEMLVDTGYALAHNGGPIFNKTGVNIYSCYDGHFVKILDIQRSGQIPDLILGSEKHEIKQTDIAKQAVQLIAGEFPQAFKGWVDWGLVDSLRPDTMKQKYPGLYDGLVNKPKPAYKPIFNKPKPKPVAEFGGQKAKAVGTWAVMPGQIATVYERVKA